MTAKDWGLPEKHRYTFPPQTMSAVWMDAEDNRFVDVDIEFDSDLTPDERREVMLHFVLGLQRRDIEYEYDIMCINFFSLREIMITFRKFPITGERALFALLMELRQQFAVIRIGNMSYQNDM